MSDHGSHSILVDSIEDVEEVSAIGELAFRQLRREIDGDLGVILELGIEVGDGDFVVFGRIALLDLRQLEELLVAGEDLAEEVLVGAGVWWDVEPTDSMVSNGGRLTGGIHGSSERSRIWSRSGGQSPRA